MKYSPEFSFNWLSLKPKFRSILNSLLLIVLLFAFGYRGFGQVLTENFSSCSLGSHSTPDGTDISASLNTYLSTSGWTGSKIYQAGGEIKLGSSSSQGYIITKTIDLSGGGGNATLTFDLCDYSSDGSTIQIFHAPNGSSFSQIGSDISSPSSYGTQTITITGGLATSKIKIAAKSASGCRFFIDNLNVIQSCASPITIWSDNFDGTNTWTSGGNFAVGAPGASNTCTSPRSATKVLGTVLNGNYADGLTDETVNYSYSTAINCSGYTNSTLSYYSYSQFESCCDYGKVYVSSDNGSTWNSVETYTGTSEAGWTLHSYSISSYADNHSQVKIKFTMYSDVSNHYTGWNIDDISITGCSSCVAPTLSGASQAAAVCDGSTATINLTGLVASSTGNAIDYKINGVQQTPVTGVTANGSGNASFTSAALVAANNGQTLQITKITNGSCNTSFTTNATMSVNSIPTGSNCTAVGATACTGSGSVVTVSSTSLATGTYTVTYNVSGTNTVSSTTASMSFTSGSPGTGTFTTSALSTAGASNVVHLTAIAFSSSTSCTYTLSTNTAAFTTNATPAASNFSASAATICSGTAATVTVSSTSLATGTYTVTYNVSGTNTVSSTTASMSFTSGSPGTGTFTTSTLSSAGASNVVNITAIAFSSTLTCTYSLSSSTSAFTTGAFPTASNFSASGATACAGSGATVTVSSSTLATGAYTVTYNVSGTNTVTSTTATMSFTSGSPGSGTFATSALSTAGASNVVNITAIAFTASTSCTTSLSTSTAAFTTNALPTASNFSATAATVCGATGATVTVSSTTIATGAYTVTYNVSGTNTVSSTTATMSFTSGSPGTGTFTTSALSTGGASNVVNITAIAFTASTSCTYTLSSKSTPAFVTGVVPTASNFSVSAAAACAGSGSQVTVSSSTLATGAYTVTYNVSGTNTVTSTTATMTFTSGSPGSGKFTTSALSVVGSSNVVNVTAIAFTASTSCTTSLSASTAAFTTNALPTASNFSATVAAMAAGSGAVVTVTSSTLADGAYTVTYNVSGTNTVSSTTATMTFASGTGTFTTATLSSSGSSNVVNITAIAFTATSSCTYSLSVSTSTFSSAKTWNGVTSTDWYTSSNWSPSGVPTSSDDIIIPSGTPHACIVTDCSTNAYCKNLTVALGATFTCNQSTVTFYVYGDLNINGTFNHPGSLYIFLEGASNNITGTGATSVLGLEIQSDASYTVTSDLTSQFFWTAAGGTVNIGNHTLTTDYFYQEGNFTVGATGTVKIGGPATAAGDNPGGGNPYFTTGNLTLTAGSTIYYNAGDVFTACSQTVKSITYQYLKINTCNGYIATIGSGSGFTVNSDLTIINPSTAGGVATTANNITLNGNFYLGNTGNALTLNLANRIARSSTGTATFTMGNNDSHAINVTYANSNGTSWAISIGASGVTTPLTFYGTVTYNSSSSYGQPVMSNTYKNLTISGSATRSLTAATTINGNLTLNAGMLDVVSSSNYGITLGGDWVNAGGSFNAQSGLVTFAGTGLQNFNVTTAGGSTAYNADFTFNNVLISNASSSGVDFYYSNTNSRKINITDITINNGCKFISIGQ